MLSKLSNIAGFAEYKKFIAQRSSLNEHWKAEIKALYEINKPHQELTRITSQEENNPEGIFTYKKRPHLLECAYIGRDIDPSLRSEYVDKITKSFSDLSSLLTQNYANHSILILVNDVLPAQKDLTKLRNQISVNLHKDLAGFTITTSFGRVLVAPIERNKPLESKSKLFSIVITAEAFTVVTDHTILQKKIMSVIMQKQKQFRKVFPDYGKVYYLYIEAGQTELASLDYTRIGSKLKKDELAVITTTFINYSEQGQETQCEIKILVAHGFDARGIDLFNKFYTQVMVHANVANELTKRKRIAIIENFDDSQKKSLVRF